MTGPNDQRREWYRRLLAADKEAAQGVIDFIDDLKSRRSVERDLDSRTILAATTRLAEINHALGDLLAVIFRDGGHRRAAIGDDVAACSAAEGEVLRVRQRANDTAEELDVAIARIAELERAIRDAIMKTRYRSDPYSRDVGIVLEAVLPDADAIDDAPHGGDLLKSAARAMLEAIAGYGCHCLDEIEPGDEHTSAICRAALQLQMALGETGGAEHG